MPKTLKNGQPILINRFWSHVADKADATAVLVKNPNQHEPILHVGAAGYHATAVVTAAPKFSKITWAHSGRIVAAITARLIALGVKRGDRVAVLSWNCPEWVWTDLAIQTLGAVSVPIYPNNGADQVTFTAENAGAQLLIADSEGQKAKAKDAVGITCLLFDDLTADSQDYQFRVKGNKDGIDYQIGVDPKLGITPAATRILDLMIGQADDAFPFMEATADGVTPVGVRRSDMAKLIYTSGSSGVPKGVIITHGNVASSCEAVFPARLQLRRRRPLSLLPAAGPLLRKHQRHGHLPLERRHCRFL